MMIARTQLAHALLRRLNDRRCRDLRDVCREHGVSMVRSCSRREPLDGQLWLRMRATDAGGEFELAFRLEDSGVTAFLDGASLLAPSVWC